MTAAEFSKAVWEQLRWARARDLTQNLALLPAARSPQEDGVRLTGVRNIPDAVNHYRSPLHFSHGAARFRSSAPWSTWVALNYCTDEFARCDRKRIYCSLEPPQNLTEETLNNLVRPEVTRVSMLFSNAAVDRRLFYPVIPGSRARHVRALERQLRSLRNLRQSGSVCLINRYCEREDLELNAQRRNWAEAFGRQADVYGFFRHTEAETAGAPILVSWVQARTSSQRYGTTTLQSPSRAQTRTATSRKNSSSLYSVEPSPCTGAVAPISAKQSRTTVTSIAKPYHPRWCSSVFAQWVTKRSARTAKRPLDSSVPRRGSASPGVIGHAEPSRSQSLPRQAPMPRFSDATGRRMLRLLKNVGFSFAGNQRHRYEARHDLLSALARRAGLRMYNRNLAWMHDEEFNALLERFPGPVTDVEARAFTLYSSARATRHLPGDTAECGVWKGLGSYLTATATLRDGRCHHGFDSFMGLSEPMAVDIPSRRRTHRFKAGEMAAEWETVRDNLAAVPRLHLYPGWIPERFAEVADRTFCFVHVDVDLYAPSLASLQFFYPRLVNGGILLCDDYGSEACPGARLAVDEYVAQVQAPLIHLPTGQALLLRTE